MHHRYGVLTSLIGACLSVCIGMSLMVPQQAIAKSVDDSRLSAKQKSELIAKARANQDDVRKNRRYKDSSLTTQKSSVLTQTMGLTAGVDVFSFSGGDQEYTVPPGVTEIGVDVIGAQGGQNGFGGGLGGRTRAIISVSPNQVIKVIAGQQGYWERTHGNLDAWGYPGVYGFGGSPGPTGGSSGGGLSALRSTSYPYEFLMVAGGGGGSGDWHGYQAKGGAGGPQVGGSGSSSLDKAGGVGGSQTAGGVNPDSYSFHGDGNYGGSGIIGSGGGGGGYYGGSSGAGDIGFRPSAGGGGSSYAPPTATNVDYEAGVNMGNGAVMVYTDLVAFNALTDVTPGAIAATQAEKLGGSNPSMKTNNCCVAQPVDTSTGNFFHTFTLASLSSPVGIPLSVTQTFNSANATIDGPLGYGWSPSFATRLTIAGNGDVTATQENGSQVNFTRVGSTYTAPTRVLASLSLVGSVYTLTRKGGEKLDFDLGGKLLRRYGSSSNVATGFGVTTFSYDASGKLITATDPVGKTLTFAYVPGTARVSSIADSSSRSTSFTYDGAGNMSSFTAVDGAVTTFTYDGGHRMLTMLDPNQQSATAQQPLTNTYDASGRVENQTDYGNRTTTFQYVDDATIVTDPTGNKTCYVYRGGMLKTMIKGYDSPSQVVVDREYDLSTNSITRNTISSNFDPRTYVTSASYDNRGRMTSQTDPENRSKSFTYNGLDRVLTATVPNPSTVGPATVTTTNTYDPKGNLLTRAEPLYTSATAFTNQVTAYNRADTARPDLVTSMVNPLNKVTTFTYNSAGFQTQVTSPQGRVTKRTYDLLGRLKTVIAPKGNVSGATAANFTTTYNYDNADRQLSASTANGSTPIVVTNTYDLNGQLLTSKDANNHITTNTFDKAGQLVESERPDGTSIGTEYFDDGTIKSQTDAAGGKSIYTRDLLGRVTSVKDPLNRITAYTYDALGNVLKTTDSLGRDTTATYNKVGQELSVTYSDGTTPNVATSYNSAGALTTQVDGTGTNTSSYDSLGRLTATTAGTGATVGYTYDLANQLTQTSYPGNKTVTRVYSNDGLVSSIADWLGHTNTFTYDKNGSQQGVGLGNGANLTNTYTNAGLLTKSSYKDPGNWDMGTFNTTYDPAGLVQANTNSGYAADLGTGSVFTNDANDRVTNASGKIYTYDNADNPTTLLGGVTQTFDVANQLTSSTMRGGTTFSYNALGQRTKQTPTAGQNAVNYSYNQAGGLTHAVSDNPASTYSAEVESDNPGVYYRLNGPNDDNAWDTSGNEHGFFSGSWKNSAPSALKGEDIDGAVSFNSNQGQLWFDSVPANLGANQETTVEFFVRWDKDQGAQPEIPFTFRSFYGLTFNNGHFGFTTKSDASDVYGVSADGLENRWIHVAATFHNGNVAQSKLYIDGVQQTLSQKQGMPAAVSVDDHASLSGNDNGDHHMDGTIDELAFFTSPLSATRVAAHAKAAHQIDANYSYFANGLRATKEVGNKTNTFTWDVDQQLIADGENFYIYDPQGNPLEQVNATTGEVHYFSHDNQENATGLSDQYRFVSANFAYDSFGNITKSRGLTDTPLKYRGEYRDSETGFTYLRHRYYDSETAQFISRDPLVSVTRSAYSYSNNSPLNYEDPTGLAAPLVLAAAAIEVAMVAYDAYHLYQTFADPCSSDVDKAQAVGYLGIDLVGGGAATFAFRAALKTTRFSVDALKAEKIGTRWTGPFPHEAAPGAVLVRRDKNGSVTNYQRFDSDGLPLQRVDVVGRSHAGIDTPHTLLFDRNTNPVTGKTYVKKGEVHGSTFEEWH